MPQAVTVVSNKSQANEMLTMRECLIYLSLCELFIILLESMVYKCSSSFVDLSVVNGANKSCQDAKKRYYFSLVLLQRSGKDACKDTILRPFGRVRQSAGAASGLYGRVRVALDEV